MEEIKTQLENSPQIVKTIMEQQDIDDEDTKEFVKSVSESMQYKSLFSRQFASIVSLCNRNKSGFKHADEFQQRVSMRNQTLRAH